MKTLWTVLAAATLASAQGDLAAQGLLDVELRGGYNMPAGDFADTSAESDIGYGVDLGLHLAPAFSIYAGWGRDRFSCELCGDDDKITSQGFDAGLQFTLARGAPVEFLLRGGFVYHKVEAAIGPTSVESDYSVGVQGTAGLAFPLGTRASLVPALRFQTLDPSISIAGDEVSADGRLSHVTLQLGLRVGH